MDKTLIYSIPYLSLSQTIFIPDKTFRKVLRLETLSFSNTKVFIYRLRKGFIYFSKKPKIFVIILYIIQQLKNIQIKLQKNKK